MPFNSLNSIPKIEAIPLKVSRGFEYFVSKKIHIWTTGT